MMPEAENRIEEHQELILPVFCTEGSGLMMTVSLAYNKQVVSQFLQIHTICWGTSLWKGPVSSI